MSKMIPFDHAAFRQDCIDRFRAMSDGELLGTLAAIGFDRGFAGAKMTYIGRLFGEIKERGWDMSNIKTDGGWGMYPCTLRNNVMIKIDIGIPRDRGGLFLFSKDEIEKKGAMDDFKRQLLANGDIQTLAKKRTMEFYENDLYNR